MQRWGTPSQGIQTLIPQTGQFLVANLSGRFISCNRSVQIFNFDDIILSSRLVLDLGGFVSEVGQTVNGELSRKRGSLFVVVQQ